MSEEIKPGHVCHGCAFNRLHGKNCWYYWELKKECTMYEPDIGSAGNGN